MNKKIQIIDYGMGNLLSAQRGFEAVGGDVKIVKTPEQVDFSEKLVLPGVGSFRDGIDNLKQRGFFQLIKEYHAKSNSFLLGICLGMQMLSSYGEENGGSEGLDIIPGRVIQFQSNKDYPIPHVGWNSVKQANNDGLYGNIPSGADFYFVHSYHFKLDNDQHSIGKTQYGIEFNAIVKNNKSYGVQFHPEKSQKFGLELLNNFVSL